MALIETPGAANANTYATEAEADAELNANYYYKATWAALGTGAEAKEQVLRMAARLLDIMPEWTGAATYPSVQALTWPRTGMSNRHGYPISSSVIPVELKQTQVKLAIQLLSKNTAKNDPVDESGLTNLKVGSIGLAFKELVVPKVIPDEVFFELVPSWFTRIRKTSDVEPYKNQLFLEIL